MDYVEFLELRHSDDELMHRSHKYIKKYKSPSGKWVYVYATKRTHESIAASQKQALRKKELAKSETDFARNYVYKSDNDLKLMRDAYSNNGRVTTKTAKLSADDARGSRYEHDRQRELGRISANYQIRYNDLLTQNSVRTKLNKAKTWVSNLFKRKK